MANNKKGNNQDPKMPRFNMNWIYTLVIIALAILFFTGGGDALASGSKEDKTS